MSQTADVVRTGITGRDALNKPVYGEVSRTTYPARLEQRGTAEGEAFVVDAWTAYLPADADVRPGDSVETAGREFAVQGTPSRNTIPGFPGVDHLQVELRFIGEVR